MRQPAARAEETVTGRWKRSNKTVICISPTPLTVDPTVRAHECRPGPDPLSGPAGPNSPVRSLFCSFERERKRKRKSIRLRRFQTLPPISWLPPLAVAGSPRRHSSDRVDGGGSGSQIAADASSFRGQPPCDEERHLGGSAEPASKAKTMQEQGSSSIAAASSSSLPAPEAVAHVITEVALPASSLPSTASVFLARRSSDWGLTFFIRVDIEGSFHSYPDMGGPFQSLQEAQSAIDRHLEDRRVPKMCMKQAKVSRVEMAIRTCLYYPDGTRKRCSQSHAAEKSRDAKRRFVQALVDNHNSDHNLFGDTAYELKDVLQYYSIVRSMRQGEEHEELLVTCFCMVKPIDNGHCYGCKNHGRFNMKHPNEASAYIGGHLDICMPMTLKTEWNDEEDV